MSAVGQERVRGPFSKRKNGGQEKKSLLMCLETGDGSSNTPWLHCSTRSLRPLELTLRKKSRNAFWNPAAQRSREAAPPNLHTAVNHGPNHGGSSLDVVCHGRVYEFNVSNKLAPKLLHVISGGGD